MPFDVHGLIDGLVDADSFFEIKPLFAAELVVGFGRIDGRPVGVVANNSAVRGGVLFVDSADKAARFIWLCDAFNVPLLYLADVPGFMIGSDVERQGIIRHGAKMITAVSEATVPQVSVIVRKAYGAGLYAMDGPGFMPDACIALPTAKIAVMGPQAAVNAVYANKIEEIADPDERAAFVADRRAEYEQDVDLLRLASDLVLDAIIEPSELRAELIRRYAVLVGKPRERRREAARGAADMTTSIQLTGTEDPVEIAAVVAASRLRGHRRTSGRPGTNAGATSAPRRYARHARAESPYGTG